MLRVKLKHFSAFTVVSVRTGTQCSDKGALISTSDLNFLRSLEKLLKGEIKVT